MYILRRRDVLQTYLNNIVFKISFGLVATLLFFSFQVKAQGMVERFKNSEIIVISDSNDDFSLELSEQLSQIFRYTKFPNKFIDLYKGDTLKVNTDTPLVISTAYSLSELPNTKIFELENYIRKGGKLIFLGPITDIKLAFLQGIEQEAEFSTDSTVRGITAIHDIYPSFKGKSFYSPNTIAHKGLKRENLHSSIRVLATGYTNTQYPFMYEHQIGKGHVLVVNSLSIYDKMYRGIMFSAMIKYLPNMPYRVANVGTIFLDDFPAPLYNVKIEPIATEYDIEQAEFVVNEWWPDMKYVADSLYITYSAMTAFNYNANVVPPFDFSEWESGKLTVKNKAVDASVYVAQDILKTRHELALHGYNHFSLLTSDWPNKQFMVSSLKATDKRWKIDDLGPLPVSYVPPTNYIDSVGVQALKTGMPSIKYLSSLYLGDVEFGGGREFGIDPYHYGIFDYPRSTSGFTMKENSLFDQHGMQLLTGIWNHFVHPDDVFQVIQRDADAFDSRNPDGLGWKTSSNSPTGLYHEYLKRLSYTRTNYPFIRLVSASYGAPIARSFVNSNSSYYRNNDELLVTVNKASETVKQNKSNRENHWFMYVHAQDFQNVRNILSQQVEGVAFSKIWDGYLVQFYESKNVIKVPLPTIIDIKPFIAKEYIAEPIVFIDPETLLQEALDKYAQNSNSRSLQNKIIDLGLETGSYTPAIEILEKRILSTGNWALSDQSQLITFYGYTSDLERAENFLEQLWMRYPTQRTIAFKNEAVNRIGVYSEGFEARWAKREIEVFGFTEEHVMPYIRLIESPNTWPEVKPMLVELIDKNATSDSLYAYTLQRSFFYDSADVTIELLETFPPSSHPQLSTFATSLANIYAYQLSDFESALYWSNYGADIPVSEKLNWIAELGQFERYYLESKSELRQNPNNDSLRVQTGTRLYYEGYQQRAYELLYPLFEARDHTNTAADTLITAELRFKSYDERLAFYDTYPAFFSSTEQTRLLDDLRWNEGLKASIGGSYFYDNFDNSTLEGDLSIQWGNRTDITHQLSTREIIVQNRRNNTTATSNLHGLGYLFEHRDSSQTKTFKFGISISANSSSVFGSALIGGTISYDSTFTSATLSFEPVLTLSAINRNIYKGKLEFYREDPWFNSKVLTTVFGNTQYYTNNVYDGTVSGRLYIQPSNRSFRMRGIAELSYADASKEFLNAIPYFTQNDYFLKGVGLDLRYRSPNTFDYKTLFEAELMGKHAQRDGYFMTGRVNIEHKFDNYWFVKLGTEYSTSSIYQSNRIFLTISHYFRKTLK